MKKPKPQRSHVNISWPTLPAETVILCSIKFSYIAFIIILTKLRLVAHLFLILRRDVSLLMYYIPKLDPIAIHN